MLFRIMFGSPIKTTSNGNAVTKLGTKYTRFSTIYYQFDSRCGELSRTVIGLFEAGIDDIFDEL